jgi:trehalose 6-phosphate synthase
VGDINGAFADVGTPVVHYLHRSVDADELVAMYRAADVMLVTPFRDGMNLVAKEYVAARVDGAGSLVLSEFAGAADELPEARLVNPHDVRSMHEAITQAVLDERKGRDTMRAMRGRVMSQSPSGWATDFLGQLARMG